MKRALTCAVIALGPWCGHAVAAVPRAQLRAFACRRGPDPRGRAISVTAVMRPRPGTRRMELRFQLIERMPGGSSATLVSGGDLGRWLRPRDPTLGSRPGDVWILRHPVSNLAGPARYRFRVSFRWLGARRRVLGERTLTTRWCYEP